VLLPSPMTVLAPVLDALPELQYVPPGDEFVSLFGVTEPGSPEETAYRRLAGDLYLLTSLTGWRADNLCYELRTVETRRYQVPTGHMTWETTVVCFGCEETGPVPAHQLYLLFHENVVIDGTQHRGRPASQLLASLYGTAIDLTRPTYTPNPSGGVEAEERSVLAEEVMSHVRDLRLEFAEHLASLRRKPTSTHPPATTQPRTTVRRPRHPVRPEVFVP
jgi:hypothetical protein